MSLQFERLARNPLGAGQYTVLLALFFTSVFVALVLTDTTGREILVLVTNRTAFAKVVLILACSDNISF